MLVADKIRAKMSAFAAVMFSVIGIYEYVVWRDEALTGIKHMRDGGLMYRANDPARFESAHQFTAYMWWLAIALVAIDCGFFIRFTLRRRRMLANEAAQP
ncbi:hypothetical protein P3T43_007264 [Paraburkholderia sp. GAS41]|uniref:hypothetical protein n=1 Tax=Paraburkholderia sp. GAS41 TaxID=3035134 RepID=UPI003D2506D7